MTYKATGRRPGPPSAAPELIAEALRLAAETTPEDAAVTLKERGAKVSSRAIREWQKGMKGARHVAAEKLATLPIPPGLLTCPEPAPPPPAPHVIEPPPTPAERKIDELVASSRTWRRVMGALAEFAREHPTVAPSLAAKLRSLNL